MKSICFSNLKGGVGKSSITLQAANYYSQKGKSVVIIDCDLAQKTLITAYDLSENPPYDVIPFDPSVDMEQWEKVLSEVEPYDYVFFDIPGTIHQAGILPLLSIIDNLIVITRHSIKDLASTQVFIELLKSKNITDFKVLYNMLRPYRDTDHRELVEEIISGVPGSNSELLGINPSAFFQTNFMEHQKDIEKTMEIGLVPKKIDERYAPFFAELDEFINRK